MWPAATIQEVLERTTSAARKMDGDNDRLVSLLFAARSAPIWDELTYTRADLDAIAGPSWDLFFIGVPMVAREDTVHHYNWVDHFDQDQLREAAEVVHAEHRAALTGAGMSQPPWSYDGGTEVVSFLFRAGIADWLSLRACSLNSDPGNPSDLSELTWRQKRWRDGVGDDPIFWSNPYRADGADGELVHLGAVLTGVAASLGMDVAGNGAFELVKTLAGA